MHGTQHIPGLVRQIYAIVEELERLFPGRRFTPDGHLVGSIGEVLAAHRYGLTLLPSSSEAHDALSKSGIKVQVKATQGKTVAMRSEPDHLIVLKILEDGSDQEIYNGPGAAPWLEAGKLQRNGQRPISLTRLRSLMERVQESERLSKIGA